MGAKRPKVSIYDRESEFKNDGLYVSDSKNGVMMCEHCNCSVTWNKKSTILTHLASQNHETKKNQNSSPASKSTRQTSIPDSFDKAEKEKSAKEMLNKDTAEAFLKANIPLHKLDHPALKKWMNEHVTGGGDIVTSKWMREKYVPKLKLDCDKKIKELVKDKPIVIMCDETTNRKGEAVFQVMFRVLPSSDHVKPLLLVASVTNLSVCSGDSCSKEIIKTLNRYNVPFENVVGVSSDSAPYMNLCVRLLKELVNPQLEHIQCWDHKLDKISKVFSNKLPRLNECVAKTKKLFKNTRKRKSL